MEHPQDKITARHRERRAYIYIRQSTPKQVQHHLEGQRNQYALVQRAITLGWPAARVHVIDTDLGQSGQDSQRPGFQELVTAISLGHVGIIVAYEASRLARNNTDWYTLLDLATVVGTLIADTEGVYDPRPYNDRLLLACVACSVRPNCISSDCAWMPDANGRLSGALTGNISPLAWSVSGTLRWSKPLISRSSAPLTSSLPG